MFVHKWFHQIVDVCVLPLTVVRIKGAIKKLSDELHEMEVRIGVVSNTLLQLSLKNRRLLQNQAVMSDEDDI
jgi:estrogen-related receptor beta like 1